MLANVSSFVCIATRKIQASAFHCRKWASLFAAKGCSRQGYAPDISAVETDFFCLFLEPDALSCSESLRPDIAQLWI
jgi:hypothetical protein